MLVPDIMGLRPLFDEHAQRLADDNGWAVAAVEPWPGREDMPLEERLGPWPRSTIVRCWPIWWRPPTCSSVEPVGVTGFCMGGMFTYKAAGTGRFHRAVGFYGMLRVPEHWKGEHTIEPLDAVTADGACPTMAIVGTVDQWTPPARRRGRRGRGRHGRAVRGRRPRLRPRRHPARAPRRGRRATPGRGRSRSSAPRSPRPCG